jgi:hypothetical protein
MVLIFIVIFLIVTILIVLALSGITLDGHTLIRLLNADITDLSFDFKTKSANGVLLDLLPGLVVILKHGVLRLITGGLMGSSMLFHASLRDANINDGNYHNVQLKRKNSRVYLIVDGIIQESAEFSGPAIQNALLGGIPCDDAQNFIGSIRNINTSFQVIPSIKACARA